VAVPAQRSSDHAGARVVASGVSVLAALLTAGGIPVAIAAHQVGASLTSFIAGASCLLVGAILAHRQPRNAIGLVLLGSSAFFALNSVASSWSVFVFVAHHRSAPLGDVAVVLQPSWAPAIALFAVSILLFPDGRVPRGPWRPALIAFLLIALVWLVGAFGIAIDAVATHAVRVDASGNLLAIDRHTGGNAWWGGVQDAFFPTLILSAIAWVARQVAAFRRADAVGRLQLKWLVTGAVISIVGGVASVATAGSSGVVGAIGDVLSLGVVAFPASIGVAVQRYRLYEVDRVISRTLAYALLSGLLIGVFIGLVVLATDVLALSGRVGVVASTLAAAALFNPLRVRIQRLVDRRFNRARYNADAIVAAFTARLRDAVEIDTVRSELLSTVTRAVQPTHASVWIKP
jgi:hypothetical protein